MSSSPIKIKRCGKVMNGRGCTIRRKVKEERLFAFKLAIWQTFVIEKESDPEPFDQLNLF
ncbi:hypothetical protein [Vibrio sp. OPT18]|uniref:hypothetical protein n=1 Tax=Vibrio sp. OPT18 TaxID=2778641 RepID=UPI0018827EF1|nr:hypothetical protein [Vibrio sp. OPT18]